MALYWEVSFGTLSDDYTREESNAADLPGRGCPPPAVQQRRRSRAGRDARRRDLDERRGRLLPRSAATGARLCGAWGRARRGGFAG